MATGELMPIEPRRFRDREEPTVERVMAPETDPRLGLPHAPEDAATKTSGAVPWSADDLTADWVVERLMREATDYGSRTRQTSRVAALRTLAEVLGVVEEGLPNKGDSKLARAAALSKEDRLKMIREKALKLGLKVT